MGAPRWDVEGLEEIWGHRDGTWRTFESTKMGLG